MRRRSLKEFLASRAPVAAAGAAEPDEPTEPVVADDSIPPQSGKPGVFAKPRRGSYAPFAKSNAARGVGFGR